MNDSDALEVSMLVWFDDEFNSWVYSVIAVHGEEETIIAWGDENATRDEAAADAVREVKNYFMGV